MRCIVLVGRRVCQPRGAAENLAKGDAVALEFVREREEGLTTELERLVLGLVATG